MAESQLPHTCFRNDYNVLVSNAYFNYNQSIRKRILDCPNKVQYATSSAILTLVRNELHITKSTVKAALLAARFGWFLQNFSKHYSTSKAFLYCK